MTPFEELGLFATVSDLKFVKMLIDMNTQAMIHLIERQEMSQKKISNSRCSNKSMRISKKNNINWLRKFG